MPERHNYTTTDETIDEALRRERDALVNAARLRWALSVSAAGVVGFALGAYTTYQIACALRPRR
ncbi:MAG: hypothetical protein KC420_14720 [Myxococcales bacterium]|nr:hypothetical protein [Myxococcales bacterium]